uniref:Chromosome transmission fidelity protein 8 homolog n=1 Tax=Schistocephalus solidus TaxID=70667 RepID=A0A183TF62_SCHSO
LLELQGEISHNNEDSVAGKIIGDLHFTRQNEPILIIGHNLLCGKVSKLPRPFAVLQRSRFEGSTNLSVKAIIRTKILFKTRPKPIIWMKH